jgi:hypothetical protein
MFSPSACVVVELWVIDLLPKLANPGEMFIDERAKLD